ncbi:MAG: lysophospholipid acyltransferase family protein [Clostridia bacterium]
MGKFLYNLIAVLKQPFKLVFPTKIFGSTNFEQKKAILAFNHVSGWDPLVWTIWTSSRARFLYKSQFDRNPFLKFIFKALEYVPINRGEVDLVAIKKCMSLLQDDKIFGVFPEGTRNKEIDRLQEIKVGTAMLAIKTKSPIRPIYIFDRTKAFCKNYFLVGDEFTLDEYYGKQLTKQVLAEATTKVAYYMDKTRQELINLLKEKGITHRKRRRNEIIQREQFIINKEGINKEKTVREVIQHQAVKELAKEYELICNDKVDKNQADTQDNNN